MTVLKIKKLTELIRAHTAKEAFYVFLFLVCAWNFKKSQTQKQVLKNISDLLVFLEYSQYHGILSEQGINVNLLTPSRWTSSCYELSEAGLISIVEFDKVQRTPTICLSQIGCMFAALEKENVSMICDALNTGTRFPAERIDVLQKIKDGTIKLASPKTWKR